MADFSGLCVLCGRDAVLENAICKHTFCEPCSKVVIRCPRCSGEIGTFNPVSFVRPTQPSAPLNVPQGRDLSALYGAPNTDIDIIVNQEDKYKCHKVVLQETSRVLRDLSQTTPVIVLILPDASAFPLFLRYLYTRVLPAQLENASLISLTKLANELQVDSLSTLVEQRIEVKFNTPAASSTDELLQLAFGVLPQLSSFANRSASRAIIDFVAEHAALLFRQTNLATNVPESILAAILNSSRLRVGTHRQLERFLQTWISSNSHSESILAIKQNQSFIQSTRQDPFGLASSVVCFFADGTDRYTHMTITAITSFLAKTPGVSVGIIVPHNDNKTREKVESSIPAVHKHRIIVRYATPVPHFANWNPTQYKMDIIQFTEEYLGFDNVFWFDSDTITTDNLSSFLSRFSSQSEKLFYFTPDHVMYDPIFLQRWKDLFHTTVMVPQACVMGFKTSVIPAFFDTWKSYWRKFIEPSVFSQLPDPRPHFEGSAFCTEQYALGLALTHNDWHTLVLVFERRLILVPSEYASGANRGLITLEVGSHGAAGQLPLVSFPTEESLIQAMASVSISINRSISSSLSLGFKLKPGDVVADMFGGAVIHSYNQQYAQVLRWHQSSTI